MEIKQPKDEKARISRSLLRWNSVRAVKAEKEEPNGIKRLENYWMASRLSSLSRSSITCLHSNLPTLFPANVQNKLSSFLPSWAGHFLVSLTFVPLPTQSSQSEITLPLSIYSNLVACQGPCRPGSSGLPWSPLPVIPVTLTAYAAPFIT